MNLLTEVLISAEKIELEKIDSAVPQIIQAVEHSKTRVNTFIENVYATFSHNSRRHRMLVNDATRLYNETMDLRKELDQLSKKDLGRKSSDIDAHAQALSRITLELNIILNIRDIQEGLLKISKLSRSKMYLLAMAECKTVENCIKSIPEEEITIALEEMKTQFNIQKEVLLLNELSNSFRDNVILRVNDGKITSMKILKNNEEITEIVQALYVHSSSVFLLDEVTKFLWEHVFVPVVDYITEIIVSDDENSSVLEVIIKDSTKTSPYTEVFSNLKTIVTYLHDNFSFQLKDDFLSIHYVSRDLRDNLSELIIKHCLQNTIPSTNEGLEKYNVVIEDTKQLEQVLVNCDIFTQDTLSILTYANNIDIHFINRRCQEYIKIAKNIMLKDLHNMKEVGAPYDAANPLASLNEFSKCCVSKSAIELITHIERILQEATNSTDICAGRLFCTARNILEQYTIFVPEYHKKLLQTIPQQMALYHNNCLYLAKMVVEWGETYSHILSSKLTIDPIIFRDSSFVFRTVATEMFSSYVESQIKQIEEIMQDVGLHNVQTLEKLEPNTEKCIRQCLRQQELLKTVWCKVLSYPIYNKTIGVILNSFCNLLIDAVVKLEDIPSDVAEQLVDILKIIVTRGPKLFTDSKEVSLFVPSWYKFNELVFVLNSSLLDINDRWADGKGPLALQFKPEELKQLIRALFQNTDRRAAVLAKIMQAVSIH